MVRADGRHALGVGENSSETSNLLGDHPENGSGRGGDNAAPARVSEAIPVGACRHPPWSASKFNR
ncbi:hypothetical protein GCM10022206_27600 [Streptomyces chiangmaiensis]